MKAAVLHEVGKPLVIEDVQVDDPGPREVLVRTVASGVCHSDYHYMNGSYTPDLPVVLGHEAGGIVEKVGRDVTYLAPGDHVISCLSMFCGSCRNCLIGKTYICENSGCDQTARERETSSVPKRPHRPSRTWSGCFCRADAFARTRFGQDPPGHAVGSSRLDRLRGDHWRRLCDPHGRC